MLKTEDKKKILSGKRVVSISLGVCALALFLFFGSNIVLYYTLIIILLGISATLGCLRLSAGLLIPVFVFCISLIYFLVMDNVGQGAIILHVLKSVYLASHTLLLLVILSLLLEKQNHVILGTPPPVFIDKP